MLTEGQCLAVQQLFLSMTKSTSQSLNITSVLVLPTVLMGKMSWTAQQRLLRELKTWYAVVHLTSVLVTCSTLLLQATLDVVMIG